VYFELLWIGLKMSRGHSVLHELKAVFAQSK